MAFRRNLLAVAAMAGTTLLSTLAHADVTNGSFEVPTCTSGYCNYGVTGDNPGSVNAITGWTITHDNVDIVQSNTSWGAAKDGHQMLDLVGYGSAGGIAQSFATAIGQTYTLSFWYANNPYSGFSSANVAVTGAGGGNLLSGAASTISHSDSTTANLDWDHYSTTFKANSTSTTLAFDEIVGGNNGGVFLDKVSVAPVPEPASWAIAIGGLVMIGFAARRRSVAAPLAA